MVSLESSWSYCGLVRLVSPVPLLQLYYIVSGWDVDIMDAWVQGPELNRAAFSRR